MKIQDYPKIKSPFIRELDKDNNYFITDKVEEDMDWVFNSGEDEVECQEKLNGTSVSLVIENGIITSIWNRTNRIPFFCKGKMYIIEGVMEAFERGYTELPDGQHWGEVIGPKLNGNPYNLDKHIWIPFNTYCSKHLTYKSYHKYPKTYEGICKWFLSDIKDGGIFSLYMRKKGKEMKPEGVVFHNIKTGALAKLRIEMIPGYKGGRKHKK